MMDDQQTQSTYYIEIHQAQGLVIGDRAHVTQWIGDADEHRRRVEEGVTAERVRVEATSLARAVGLGARVVGVRPDSGRYFLDREQERQRIDELIADPTTRLISLIGQGGMGKTALACKVLGNLEQHQRPTSEDGERVDGIAYMSTRTAGISLERVFHDCARMLGDEVERQLLAAWTNPELSIQAKVAQLLETLSGGRYVVLLDNLDDLLDAEGKLTDEGLQFFLEQNLRSGQGAALLATTRRELGLAFDVQALDEQLRLDEGLPVEEGVALLRKLDRRGRLRGLTDDELAQVVVTAHGVPRALQLIPSLLAGQPAGTTLQEVTSRFYERPEVVKALIEENYRRLTIDARRVMDALAVLRRPVPIVAVDYLLEPFAPGLDVPELVMELVAWNIVNEDFHGGVVWLHPVDQDYAYSQLPDEENGATGYTRQALERRVAAYYQELRTPVDLWKSIDDLAPQLAEFEHLVRARECDEACRLLEVIDHDHLRLWGYGSRLVIMRLQLIEHIKDARLRMLNLGQLGSVYSYLGLDEMALNHLEPARMMARQQGDSRCEAMWLGGMGLAFRRMGDLGRAVGYYEEYLEIARSLRDTHMIGQRTGSLGSVQLDRGQIKLAITLYEESLAAARTTGDRNSEGSRLGGLGLAYLELGQISRALEFFQLALAISRELDDRNSEQLWLSSLGYANHVLGDDSTAVRLCEDSLRICRDIGNRYSESFALVHLAQATLSLRLLQEVQALCESCMALSVPRSRYQASLIRSLALLHHGNPLAGTAFSETVIMCRAMVQKSGDLYAAHFYLAAALVGKAVCNSCWPDAAKRTELLTPALAEYEQALQVCSAKGVVQGAIRDVALVRDAGFDGLEPVFELLGKYLAVE